ncbi:hypothetical protein D1872_293290 [compost metagenome]
MGEQNLRGRTGQTVHIMMLRRPIAAVPPRLGPLRQQDRLPQGLLIAAVPKLGNQIQHA